jgi:hypothetical protein
MLELQLLNMPSSSFLNPQYPIKVPHSIAISNQFISPLILPMPCASYLKNDSKMYFQSRITFNMPHNSVDVLLYPPTNPLVPPILSLTHSPIKSGNQYLSSTQSY